MKKLVSLHKKEKNMEQETNSSTEIKVGDVVKVTDTGKSYPNMNIGDIYGRGVKEFAFNYAMRYKPINCKITFYDQEPKKVRIKSGFNTIFDLSQQKGLRWRVKKVFEGGEVYLTWNCEKLYLVSSNENHMLVINEKGIEKLQ